MSTYNCYFKQVGFSKSNSGNPTLRFESYNIVLAMIKGLYAAKGRQNLVIK